MKAVAVIFLVALAVFALTATPGEAINCGDVTGAMSPCISYLTGGGSPSSSCCSGVKGLSGRLQTRGDRQTACNCLKSAASSINVRPDSAANLAGKCGVSTRGISVGPNTDCSKVS